LFISGKLTQLKERFMYGLKTESSFDAAHFLTDYHGKCENLHGHRWRVVAYLAQEKLWNEGTHKDMVIDFGDFKNALKKLTDALDHSFIFETGSLKERTVAALKDEGFLLHEVPFRPTAEQFSRYFYEQLKGLNFPVYDISVYETPTNCSTYREASL
jgi:6-pyruvoyltetrahydropterin/6-carboxytetrahydropterin synthase